jgi:RNA polymerase sigma factor (sigma-70 family)
VALKKKTAATAGPRVWTVAELGAFYTEHRSELLAHASRVLKDSAKAEEITQDALIKFMLAAPELESTEHALSYLHRTIENLCIDLFRMEGRRPNLVVLDDATAEIEASWQDNGDHSVAMSAAEDAAIIRQALAMLSPAERAALVMWEMEGRSTEEIAAELGIKESAVRHTVSRARASLRRVLSELVIDEERGLTALDMLSTSYKKAAALAQKSSKVALSLLLVITAFLGFNSMTGREGVVTGTTSEISSGVIAGDNNADANTTSDQSLADAAPTDTASASPLPTDIGLAPEKKSSTSNGQLAVKTAKISFAGLDSEGVPTGYTVVDSTGVVGKTRIARNTPVLTPEGARLTNQAITSLGGPNILLNQTITIDGNGTTYVPSVSVGINGSWTPLALGSISNEFERLSNGQYLLTSTIIVDSAIDSSFFIGVGDRGYDLSSAPKSVVTRLLLNAGKTQVLAQAILVNDAKSKGGNA